MSNPAFPAQTPLSFRDAPIVEYEQHGSDRAQYGERLLDELAHDLRRRIGKGFTKRYLEMFRRFYRRYRIAKSVIAQFDLSLPLPPSVSVGTLDWQDDAYFTRLFRELPWTHFIELIRMDDPLKRAFYEIEALRNRWSMRELKRQLDSLLYERVGLSRDMEGVLALAKEGTLASTPAEMIRDPYVFEFLGLKREDLYTESQLEQALLDRLQEFLLEMGKGFSFVARQRRVTFDNEHYDIDVLLYHRRLKCLVAIDLRQGRFRHEYAGTMNFYLNYLEAEEMEEGENPPIGIIPCSEKNETHMEYALNRTARDRHTRVVTLSATKGLSERFFAPLRMTWSRGRIGKCTNVMHSGLGGLSNRVFVSRYLLHLPTKEEREVFL